MEKTSIGRRCLLGVAIFGLTLMSVAAFGDDFYPPPWPRDLSIAMTAEWGFQTDPGVWEALEPDGVLTNLSAGGGMPTMALHDEGGVGRDGEWYFENGGVLAFVMDDVLDLEPIKYLWIQVTHSSPVDTIPTVWGIYAQDEAEPSGELLASVDFDVNHHLEVWTLVPNPDWEIIGMWVPAGVAIDQVIIDTISVPEPMTIVLLGFGSLVLMRRRRS